MTLASITNPGPDPMSFVGHYDKSDKAAVSFMQAFSDAVSASRDKEARWKRLFRIIGCRYAITLNGWVELRAYHEARIVLVEYSNGAKAGDLIGIFPSDYGKNTQPMVFTIYKSQACVYYSDRVQCRRNFGKEYELEKLIAHDLP